MLSSPGFTMSSTVLPFAVTLQPGFVLYSDQFYNGQANYKSLRNSFSNKTISLLLAPGSGSIAISKDVWLAVATGSTNPTIFYDTAPLIWPSTNQSVITVIDYQSSTCQPQCSGNGVCTASATCTCAKGFTGPSCESCASGFFGPACKPCPSSCDSCDQTSGLCLTPKAAFKVDKAQKTCNCQNGQCSSDGNCSCLPGWTNATELNGVTCAQCAPGFFMTSGNCRSKILYISFFPPSDNSQYVNLVALSAQMTRETAFLARRVSPRIKLTKRCAIHCQLWPKTRHVRHKRSVMANNAVVVRHHARPAMVRRRPTAPHVSQEHPCSTANVSP